MGKSSSHGNQKKCLFDQVSPYLLHRNLIVKSPESIAKILRLSLAF